MIPPLIRHRPLLAKPLSDLHPVVARVLSARGIGDPTELDASLRHLLPPMLAGMDVAVDRLHRAREKDERILVVGDFDADGATSVALSLRALRAFGYTAVDYLVPNRFELGYGLSRELVDSIGNSQPDVILTVDNGISSHDGVAAATERGIDVVVTDHHLPGPVLPPAIAIVNPNRTDCGFDSKHLAGVGVVFYLLGALRTRLHETGYRADNGDELPRMASFLDLVALGTVADVVRLDRNNRILVEQGLRRIRAGRATPGILALLEAARRNPARTCAADLGYAVAPRLNAAGRLADMSLGIETLLAETMTDARRAASHLDELNRTRRDIEAEMKVQADTELQRLRDQLEVAGELPAGLVLYDSRWHQGVSGILAGRVREAVHRPTVIFAEAGDAVLKGSARSIPGLHVRDVLAAIDAEHPGLIQRFGGHAMAAGLSLRRDRLDCFRQAFDQRVERALGGTSPAREVDTDGPLAVDEMRLATAEALRAAGPWGAGFPEPTFDNEFRIRSHRTVGEHHLKLEVEPLEGGERIDAIAFHAERWLHEAPAKQLRLVYRLDVNEFRGRRRLQLIVEHLEPPTAA